MVLKCIQMRNYSSLEMVLLDNQATHFKAIWGIEQIQGQRQAVKCVSINEILYFQSISSHVMFLGKYEMFQKHNSAKELSWTTCCNQVIAGIEWSLQPEQTIWLWPVLSKYLFFIALPLLNNSFRYLSLHSMSYRGKKYLSVLC